MGGSLRARAVGKASHKKWTKKGSWDGEHGRLTPVVWEKTLMVASFLLVKLCVPELFKLAFVCIIPRGKI